MSPYRSRKIIVLRACISILDLVSYEKDQKYTFIHRCRNELQVHTVGSIWDCVKYRVCFWQLSFIQ